MRWKLFLFLILISSLSADLVSDLEVCASIDRSLECKESPFSNLTLQVGYFNMPSARMALEGDIGFGYSSVPPYRNWNARVQLFENLEVTANYRIFSDILDPVFGHMGFGEFSDKGANVKLALIKPEDSSYSLPGIAIGVDDFLGTCAFHSKYIVATQVIDRFDMEFSFGYGDGRIDGFFGGASWTPFSNKRIALTCEYDAINYSEDPHPQGRTFSSRFNYGAKCRLWNLIELSGAYLRGEEFAFSAAASYNFGYTKGFLPKIDDPLPFTSQNIGFCREECIAIDEIRSALTAQGFALISASIEVKDRQVLRLKVINCKWMFEREVRCRLNRILAFLTPENIDEVRVVIESEGFSVDEFRYCNSFLQMYSECRLGDVEINLLTPRLSVSCPNPCYTRNLYKERRALYNLEILPKVHTFFGSTTGKFKYAAGVAIGSCGYLPGDVFYQARLGYIAASSLGSVVGVDYLNPSQLINVHTDIVLYYAQKTITVDQLYLQKNFHIKDAFFGRVAAGYFEQNYGGGSVELLFYPADKPWALGIEASLLGKRTLTGLGFTDKIRKFEGLVPTYVPFTGYQYYLDFYYDFKDLQLDMRLSAGEFMAHDKGVKTLIERYFDNGLRLIGWYTWTNGNDLVNGQMYHDKGVGISVPLDFFYAHSCRKKWGYSMSAWLRDVGYRAPTGHRLYDMIHSERVD